MAVKKFVINAQSDFYNPPIGTVVAQSTVPIRIPCRKLLPSKGLRRRQETKRRGRDSNPGWSYPHSGFQDRCNRPLCHLSE